MSNIHCKLLVSTVMKRANFMGKELFLDLNVLTNLSRKVYQSHTIFIKLAAV